MLHARSSHPNHAACPVAQVKPAVLGPDPPSHITNLRLCSMGILDGWAYLMTVSGYRQTRWTLPAWRGPSTSGKLVGSGGNYEKGMRYHFAQ